MEQEEKKTAPPTAPASESPKAEPAPTAAPAPEPPKAEPAPTAAPASEPPKAEAAPPTAPASESPKAEPAPTAAPAPEPPKAEPAPTAAPASEPPKAEAAPTAAPASEPPKVEAAPKAAPAPEPPKAEAAPKASSSVPPPPPPPRRPAEDEDAFAAPETERADAPPPKKGPVNLPRRRRRRRRLTALGVLLLLFALAFVFRQELGLDGLLRWYHYSDVTLDEREFEHGGTRQDLFVALRQRLLICSGTGLRVLTPSGQEIYQHSVTMGYPMVTFSGEKAVVYDLGGQELRVVNEKEVLASLTLKSTQNILSARLNERGYLAVTTKEEGYKGVVTVYDGDCEPILAIRLSSCYLTDAVVTPDGHGVYLLSPGQGEGLYRTALLYYALSSGSEVAQSQQALSLGMILDMKSESGVCTLLGERGLFFLNSKGELTAQYDYAGKYLKMGSICGDSFSAVLLSDSQSGTLGTLVTVNEKGEVLGTLSLSEAVLGVQVRGNFVAVLTAGTLNLYTRDLQSAGKVGDVLGVLSMALYADGSLNLISEKIASLCLP